MAEPSRIVGEQHFVDAVSFLDTMNIPTGTVVNASVSPSAGIAATKTVHQFPLSHTQNDGSDVTTQTELIHIAYGAGTVVAVEAVCDQAPDGDETITIDLLASSGGGAFATMLTAAIVLDSGNTDRVAEAGTVSGSNTYADGDILEITVVDGAGTGNQGQGLCVTVWVRESPA